MEIIAVNQDKIDQYLAFSKEVYRDNIYYRDTMATIIGDILRGRSQICKSSFIRPVMIVSGGKIVAVATFVIVDRMADTLQLTFFEALEGQQKAIDLLIDYGKQLAKDRGINKILVGLNIHVNYGLGLLASHYATVPSFGGAYNPPYYLDYFQRYATEEINLVSYWADMGSFKLNVTEKLLQRITSNYKVTKANFRNLSKTMEIYTYLNNRAFRSHKFYYQRKIEEDLELFQDFKILLKDENLLFLEHQGQPIGFLLWYPDFNELLQPGEKLGLKTVLKSKILPRKIRRFKIVELAVLPQYHKSGAVLALFHQLQQIVQDKYDFWETSWILEENMGSRGLGIRWADREYKQYKVFRIDL